MINLSKVRKKKENISTRGSRQQGTIPTKPRFRSVPDVMDTKFSARDRTAH